MPVLVQGVNATQSITNAINKANEMNIFDLIIVGRGGGSIEELWSFNEEAVADAIFNSKTPVISAVGHETDITISDYVSDLRAPTPTGAAELAVPSQYELLDRISKLKQSLNSLVAMMVKHQQANLERMKQSYAFRYPEQLVRQKELALDKDREQLDRAFQRIVTNKSNRYMSLRTRLFTQHPKKQLDQANKELVLLVKKNNQVMNQYIEKHSNQLNRSLDKLTLLNPLEIMKRGFAVPYSTSGEIIRSRDQVKPSDRITVNLNDGILDCVVLDIKENTNG